MYQLLKVPMKSKSLECDFRKILRKWQRISGSWCDHHLWRSWLQISADCRAKSEESKNPVKILPGPAAVEKGITDEINAIHSTFDMTQSGDSLKYINLHVHSRGPSILYHRKVDTKETTRKYKIALPRIFSCFLWKKSYRRKILKMWSDDENTISCSRLLYPCSCTDSFRLICSKL